MKAVITMAIAILTLAGCAQFTTSDSDRANLQSVADTRAQSYIECMKTEASTISSSTDYAFIAKAVAARCESSLKEYRAAQKDYLASQYMMTKKPLDISVADLESRAGKEVAELLVTRDAAAPAPQPVQAEPTLTMPSAVTAATAATVAAATTWNPEQRVYLDCMDEQADKYGRLNESAEAIAAVAADRCRNYLTIERRQALEQEGKTQVMGTIMDQRLSGQR